MTATGLLDRPDRKGIRERLSPVYRWVCSRPEVRRRIAPWLSADNVDDFSPNGRGLGPISALDRLDRKHGLMGATVLVVGVGRGPEVERYWLDRSIGHVIGIDLSAYPDDWNELRSVGSVSNIGMGFGLMDGAHLALQDSTVDIVFSQSVLEHMLDLDGFLAEAARVLKPGGRFVAYFGPLWSTYGGPHVGALAYDHLLLDDQTYLDAARNVGGGWEHWLEAGLFNKLLFDDYLDAFERHFSIDRLGVVASREGEAFRHKDPHTWSRLLHNHDEKDLLINLVSVIASPKGR